MFAFLESVLCRVKRPRVTDEYFGAVERKTLACTLDLTSVFWADAAAVLTVPFCTRWASSPDVEPAPPPRLRAARSSEARWPDKAVCTCKVQRTDYKFVLFLLKRPGSRKTRLLCPSYLFKKTSNLRLYANPARLTRRCSISPKYFT